MPYPHDEAQRQRDSADDGGVRPQNAPRYPRADDPEVTTENSPEFTDRTAPGSADRAGTTPPGSGEGDHGGTS